MKNQSIKLRDDAEPLYSSELVAAGWLPPEEKEAAKKLYGEYLTKLRDQKRNKKTVLLGIISYEIKISALKAFVTDTEFKKIWERTPHDSNGWMIRKFSSMFIRSFSPEKENLRLISPGISLTKRDKQLDKMAMLLREFCNIADSDSSIRGCFDIAFFEATRVAGHKEQLMLCSGTFLNSLHKNLAEPKGCRRMKTHYPFPRSLKEGQKAERGHTIFLASNFITEVFGRSNFSYTARILNLLRPDLGSFTETNVTKYMASRNAMDKALKKPERSRKK